MLVNDGKMSLDEPAETYLPEIGTLRISGTATNNPGRRVTLRRLLTHTAGFSQSRPEALSQLTEKRDHSLSEVVDLLLREPLDSMPGQKWLYSSPGYAVVGRLIEIVSRVPFGEFVRNRVLKPLKMDSTCFTPPQSMQRDLASPYEWKNGRLVSWPRELPALEWTYPAPDFGLYSTATDVARLCVSMFKGHGILPESLLASALAQTVPTDVTGLSDGLGWFVSRTNNCFNLGLPVNCFGHNGASGTMARANPNSGRVVVFLTQCFLAPDVVGTDVILS